MEKTRFVLLDVVYVVENNIAVIRILGRTIDGKSIVCFDSSFEPYFYAIPKEGKLQEARENLLNFRDAENGNIAAKNVHIAEKIVNGKQEKLLKVFANLPRDVPVLRKSVLSIPEIAECREYDILFFRRYLM